MGTDSVFSLEHLLTNATEEIRSVLIPAEKLSNEEARNIIGKYTAAVEGNFVPWMAAASIYARSLHGRYAASENLDDEIRENHQGMLRDFAISAGAEPELKHYQSVHPIVSEVRKLVARNNGLESLSIMATLENTSSAFIPYLESLATKLDSNNLKYTKVHGAADIEHARQFVDAVNYEMKHYEKPDAIVINAIAETRKYLTRIFI